MESMGRTDHRPEHRPDPRGRGHASQRGRPGKPVDWRRRALTVFLAIAGLGLGFLVPYMLYLNHQVGERFGQLQWQLPTRVFGRPLALRPGVAMDAQT